MVAECGATGSPSVVAHRGEQGFGNHPSKLTGGDGTLKRKHVGRNQQQAQSLESGQPSPAASCTCRNLLWVLSAPSTASMSPTAVTFSAPGFVKGDAAQAALLQPQREPCTGQ